MRLSMLGLRDFRNIAEARIGLEGRRHFFLGPNGQGKTNLLEAAGFLTALRSFRTPDSAALIRAGAAEAAIAAQIEHEYRGGTSLRILMRAEGKVLRADGEKVKRLADHLGQFPVVAFSSQDLQLLRGGPALRRRWLDLTLASMDAAYLQSLQTYARALAGRNKLLKTPSPDLAEIAAFEQVLAPAAATLVQLRRAHVADLASSLSAQYSRVSGASESAALLYAQSSNTPPKTDGGDFSLKGSASANSPTPQPAGSDPAFPSKQISSVQATTPPPAGEVGAASWLEAYSRSRPADLRLRTTTLGPHRDELMMQISGVLARDYASEGQQRSFVLALRLAQAAWFQQRSRTKPVILADDVLGELDPERRRRFWAALDPESQVLATGTTEPDRELGEWQLFRVSGGSFS